MNDLEQYEINALRADALIDSCQNSGHRNSDGNTYPVRTIKYEDGAKAIICTNCETCKEFVDAEEVAA